MLLLYLLGFTPVGVGGAALLGSFDPAHQVRFVSSPQGPRVVLHHGAKCTGHHHGLIATGLTAFSAPASPVDPDHVIQFGAATTLLRQGSTTPAAPSHEIRASSPAALCVLDLGPSRILRFTCRPIPSPEPSQEIRSLRSVVLLI